MLDYLNRWRTAGSITPEQHDTLAALLSRERMSLFVELNALLYLGVIAFAGGLAWTAQTYSAQWGDLAILLPATLLCAGCFAYCVVKAPPFSPGLVEARGLAFDYVLYLACLIFAVELGYIEYRFHLLQDRWDTYLLASSILFFAVAYRFDNRFVLSLAIATLGGWFGVRITRVDMLPGDTLRLSALAYGVVVGLVGWGLFTARIKRHFLETYLHLSANVVLAAMLSGVFDDSASALWLLGLLVAVAAAIAGGVRFRRFAFVVYGTLFGYVGLSSQLLKHVHDAQAIMTYLVASAGLVIVGLVVLSHRFGRES